MSDTPKDNEETHTPGPWFWNAYRSSIGQQDPSGKWNVEEQKKTVAIIPREKPYVEVSDADIRLMCAAPDLLDACEVMYDAYLNGSDSEYGHALVAMQNAIAKAKGDT